MGLVLVPFIHLSVYLLRGLHPQPIVMKPSAPSLPPEMLRMLLLGFAVFFVLYMGLVTLRYGIQLGRDTRRPPMPPDKAGTSSRSTSSPAWSTRDMRCHSGSGRGGSGSKLRWRCEGTEAAERCSSGASALCSSS